MCLPYLPAGRTKGFKCLKQFLKLFYLVVGRKKYIIDMIFFNNQKVLWLFKVA